MITVYQVELTKDMITEMNTEVDLGLSKQIDAYRKRWFGEIDQAIELKMFKKVAKVNTTNLEKAFEIGNIGPEESLIRLDKMCSFSVGDVFVLNKEAYLCESVGFTKMDSVKTTQFFLSVGEAQ